MGNETKSPYNHVLEGVCLTLQLATLGIDWDGPLATDRDENTVVVDPPLQPLSASDFQELCQSINPLEPSSNYGMDLYLECMSFVLTRL